MRFQATLLSLLLLVCSAAHSQLSATSAPGQAVVPRLIRFTGVVKDASGTVGVTFSLHKSQDDKTALWIETQSVPLDANGKYTVLLGATKSEGIPMDLFTSGEAQWLAVRVEGKAEQPRVLLVSVPYALKAAEAETLAGHAASEFVTNDKIAATVQQQLSTIPISPAPGGALFNANATNAGPINFSGNTTDQIVRVTQASTTGSGLVANAQSIAIRGTSTATSGTPSGVRGSAAAPGGAGVYGSNSATSGAANGVHGSVVSPGGIGVYGNNTATSGTAIGVKGTSASTSGIGVLGDAGTSGFGVRGQGLTGIQAVSTSTSNAGTAGVFINSGGGKLISGQSGAGSTEVFSVGGDGVITAGGLTSGAINADIWATGAYYAIHGNSQNVGVAGNGDVHGVEGTGTNIGVYGYANGGVLGIGPAYGVTGQSSGSGPGVFGEGVVGVNGFSNAAYGEGVLGQSKGVNGAGVSGSSSSGEGLYGYDDDAGYGILAGVSDLVNGYAGWFNGNVEVDGKLTKASGSFKIDHPLDPANKYLYHSFVESPDMMNVYNGNVTTDTGGKATVELPKWFEALNRDFRYQLTAIGQPAQCWIAEEVTNHRFTIRSDKPNVRVSWQVTGIRQDAWANANRIQVEVEKPAKERGSYLHPELFGQPEEKGVLWSRHPEAMKKWKEQREHPAPPSPKDAASSLSAHQQ